MRPPRRSAYIPPASPSTPRPQRGRPAFRHSAPFTRDIKENPRHSPYFHHALSHENPPPSRLAGTARPTTPSPSPVVFCPSRPSELPDKELVISSARSRVGRRVPSPPEAGTCLRISVDVRMAIQSETRENLPARISSAFPRHDGIRRAGTARPIIARFSLRALHAKTGAFRLPFRCPAGRFPLPAPQAPSCQRTKRRTVNSSPAALPVSARTCATVLSWSFTKACSSRQTWL